MAAGELIGASWPQVWLRTPAGWSAPSGLHRALSAHDLLGIFPSDRSKCQSPFRERGSGGPSPPPIRPADRLIIVLAAGAGAIRTLQLTDVDLGSRRLTTAGRTRPLSELTRQALLSWGWLDYRHSR